MRVWLKYRLDGKIKEEVTELVEESKVFIQGTNVQISTPQVDGWIMFEDEVGLWGLPETDILEMRTDLNPPSVN